MKRVVLGTAGHIDHGKSTLVKALTGIDPDRLKEEKERGITIELGYSRLFLEPDIVIGIVDVPGHEKFIKTMVSGATGVDMVLLVVAADEGVMAQTREHFEICKLLGVERGLVAITKVGIVDEELVELVEEEVRELVKGSFLEDAPIVKVDSVSGLGLSELKEAIREVALKTPSKPDDRPFRMYIDRVFTLKGFGTVVTGTAISGSVKVGDELEILPLDRSAKVRGIQVYGKKTEEAFSSMRVALNLSGVDKGELDRGYCVAEKGAFVETDALLAELTVSELFGHPVRSEGIYRFLAGCSISLAKLYVLGKKELFPGESGVVRIKLDRPMVLVHGDRFILRGSGTLQTYGGGVVLDPSPPVLKSSELLEYGRALRKSHHEGSVFEMLKAFGGMSKREVKKKFGFSLSELNEVLDGLERKGLVVVLGEFAIPKEVFEELSKRSMEVVSSYHRSHPIKPGMPKEELRSRLKLDEELFRTLISSLEREGRLRVNGEFVAEKGFSPSLPEDMKELAASIKALLEDSSLTPPLVKELVKKFGERARDVLFFLEKSGDVVKVSPELYLSRRAFEEFVERAKKFKEGFSVQDIKKETGLTRKYLIPYLELMDKMGLTFRAGDKRYFRK